MHCTMALLWSTAQLIKIKAGSDLSDNLVDDRNKRRMEMMMVEQLHTAGWWPNLYEPLRNIGQKVADWFAPKSEASAAEDFYEINIELPGVKPDDVDVSVHDNSITIRGEKQSQTQETGRTYFFCEREYGAFRRTFRLPSDAEKDKIDAAFKDGVLCLKIAKKAQNQPAGRKVEIRQS